jgi:hypothetical protein
MPVPKKRTTSTSEAANVESSDHTLPDAQEFRQHLRNLAVSAMRVVIEEVMREERCRSAWVPHGENSLRRGKDIAMEPTPEIWRRHRVPSKTSKFPEIEREISIPRSLTATVATNHR